MLRAQNQKQGQRVSAAIESAKRTEEIRELKASAVDMKVYVLSAGPDGAPVIPYRKERIDSGLTKPQFHGDSYKVVSGKAKYAERMSNDRIYVEGLINVHGGTTWNGRVGRRSDGTCVAIHSLQ